MKYLLGLTLSVILIVLTGCGPNSPGVSPWATTQKVYGFSFIKGEVVETFGDKVIVKIEDKDVVDGDSYEDTLTNKIIKTSMFITGMKTNLGKSKAIVEDVRGDQVTFGVKSTKLKQNDSVKIYIPKKTIAIMDFSLIGMMDNSINKFAMEDMTTRMVQSGQYIVVERDKLNSILKEQELADSGLLDERSSSKIGKLVAADIILTGSFAKQGNKWNINLRLVDVTTGIIISAINEKISGDQFRPKQAVDNSNITENFEDEELSLGWIGNILNKKGSKSKGSIDKTQGANGTSSSFKIDYFLKKQESAAVLVNRRLRDASQYSGIKFFAKAQKDTTLAVNVHDKNYDDAYVNRWKSVITVNENWKEYKIPFNRLILGKGHARSNPGGDSSFDLDSIENIAIAIGGKANNQNEHILFWIDEISFY